MRFYFVASFRIYSSVTSFCLILVLSTWVTFLDLGEVALCRKMSSGAQWHTYLWSPELYDLRVPSMWAEWALLFVGLTTVGTLVGEAGPYFDWLPSPDS